MVNCDLRGCGTSDGTASLLSDQEGEDVYDVIQWAGEAPWSTGAVAMVGVSYLALSQWKAAALRPPHLHAIIPWEGFTDAYRELLRPGGIQEVGFVKLWARGMKKDRLAYDLAVMNTEHPTHDDFWHSLVPNLPRIEVPALICGSFSDNNLHSRGSFRGFERIGSVEKHLYTHRSGKWAHFYTEEAMLVQLHFLNRHLRKQTDSPQSPPVRLEVRDRRDHVVQVRSEDSWPLSSTRWTDLHLTDQGLSTTPAATAGSIAFDTPTNGARLGWQMPTDTEITGPMALRLFITADQDDVDLIVGIEKCSRGRHVAFEGSYGFGRDRVTTGWLRASMRDLDPARSKPFQPVPTYARPRPLLPGVITQLDIPLGPSATQFRAGDQLRLVVAGRWLWPRNPLTGQFPAAFTTSTARTTCTVHWGPEQQSRLLIPVIAT